MGQRWILGMIGVLVLAIGERSVAQSHVSVVPALADSRSEVDISAGGLVPGTIYDVELTGATDSYFLDSVSATRSGEIWLRAGLPDIPTGDYAIQVFRGRVLVAETALSTTDQLVLTPPPDEVRAGDRVVLTVTGLTPGKRLRIDYADEPWFGPMSIMDQSMTIELQLPKSRPATLPASVLVSARQYNGSQLVGLDEHYFDVLAPPVDSAPEIASASLPTRRLRSGEPFVTSFSFSPSPDRSTEDYAFSLLWRQGDRGPIPIDDGVTPSRSMGATIQMTGTVPSLRHGDAAVASADPAQIEVIVTDTEYQRSWNLALGFVTYEPVVDQPLQVRVVRQSDGEPIPGALVVWGEGYSLFDVPDGLVGGWVAASDPTATNTALFGPTNQAASQVQAFIDSNPDYQLPPGAQALSQCPFNWARQLTDGDGNVDWVLDLIELEHLVMVHNVSQEVLQFATGREPQIIPDHVDLTIRASAFFLGYGPANGDIPEVTLRYDFSEDGNERWFIRSGPRSPFAPFNPDVPIVFELPEFTGNLSDTLDAVLIEGLPISYGQPFPDGDSVTVIEGLTGFPQGRGGPLPESFFVINEPATLKVGYEEAFLGPPQAVRLFLDGQFVNVLSSGDSACSTSLTFLEIDIPDAHRLEAGLHFGYIEIEPAQTYPSGPPDYILRKPFFLTVQAGPRWLHDTSKYHSQIIEWSPSEVILRAKETAQAVMVGMDDLPYGAGTINNMTDQQVRVTQTLTPKAIGSLERLAENLTEGINEPATAQSESGSIGFGGGYTFPDQVSFGGGPFCDSAGPTPKVIFDSGKIPLFRYGWGVDPIAAATLGADIWFQVLYRYFGKVTYGLLKDTLCAVTIAGAKVGLDLWFDLSVMFDLVDANVTVTPSIEVEMPVVFDDGAVTTDECFEFELSFSYEISAGFCPVCVSVGDDASFSEASPSSCSNGRSGSGLARSAPVGRVSIASDGRGQRSAIYANEAAEVWLENLNDVDAEAMQLLPSVLGLNDLVTQYFGRQTMLLLWSQNALPSADFLASSLTEATAQQHLKWMMRSPHGTVGPFDLTMPGFGDGGVQLAVCDGARAECPVGSEATAVWTRDIVGDLNQHNYRVFYSRFDGLGWTTPAPVDPVNAADVANGAKELQPSVAYIGGQAVVAWVRNPSRSLQPARDFDGIPLPGGNIHERELAYHFLDQSAGPQIAPIEQVSRGLASPKIASAGPGALILAYTVAQDLSNFLGNRRQLHYAIGQCAAGQCSFVETAVSDDLSRPVYAERPQLNVVDELALISFRHVGYGQGIDGRWAVAGDALGATTSSGDLAQLSIHLGTDDIALTALTNDAAGYLKPTASFDPSIGSTLTSGIIASPGGRGGIPSTYARLSRSYLPDFVVAGATLLGSPEAGQPVNVEVQLENTSGAVAEGLVAVELWWRAGRSAGLLLSRNDVLPSSETLELEFIVPTDFKPDEPTNIVVVVNGDGAIAELDGQNNELALPIAGLPKVAQLALAGAARGPYQFLQWAAPGDGSVKGFRVYRSDAGGDLIPIGSTFVNGYVDIGKNPDIDSTYFVAAYSDRGVLGPLSAGVSYQSSNIIWLSGFEAQ